MLTRYTRFLQLCGMTVRVSRGEAFPHRCRPTPAGDDHVARESHEFELHLSSVPICTAKFEASFEKR